MKLGAPKRILLLEDDLLIALDLEILVEDYGCNVLGPARSRAAALLLLKSHKVDAAIFDLIIEDEYCDIVADELTSLGVPWALSTGFDISALHLRYRNVPIIAKPYLKSEVHSVLDELLSSEAA